MALLHELKASASMFALQPESSTAEVWCDYLHPTLGQAHHLILSALIIISNNQ